MYTEYVTPQRVADTDYTEYNSKGGDYRPTWLIRTSDWKKVPGTEATDGYHTLSYCWEQSGEKFPKYDEEYDLKDDGHHRIVKTEKERRRISNLFRHRQQVPVAAIEVTYDELLQQICHDFDIEFLWYDNKICIDQTNKAEKQREIKQMHLIYSNARHTLALVPEIYIDDPKDFDRVNWLTGCTTAKEKSFLQMLNSLWWKRSWTLEEIMMSTQILILGRNTHLWSLADIKQGDKQRENDILSNVMLGFKERGIKSANQVLRFAHFRTSTKQHDKVYALGNIFEIMASIDIDYDSDVSTLMNGFYRQLAESDLSVMCFGVNLDLNGVNLGLDEVPEYAPTMDSYGLPSWTGVSGLHSIQAITDITLDRNCDCMIDDNMQLHIKCRSYAIRPTKYNDVMALLDDKQMKKANKNYYKVITSMDDFGNESKALNWSQWCMFQATNCLATHYHKPESHVPFISPLLPLSLTEECDECAFLGIVFDSVVSLRVDDVFIGYSHNYLSPIARKSDEDHSHKIIGVILLKHFQHDEPRNIPQEVMDKMFGNLGCESHEFYIK